MMNSVRKNGSLIFIVIMLFSYIFFYLKNRDRLLFDNSITNSEKVITKQSTVSYDGNSKNNLNKFKGKFIYATFIGTDTFSPSLDVFLYSFAKR